MKKKDFDKLTASIKQAGKIKRGKLKPYEPLFLSQPTSRPSGKN
jgi:hypothetical protein